MANANIEVTFSSADRRLLKRIADGLDRAHPKSTTYRNHPAGTRLTEPALGVESGVETNPRLMEKLVGNRD